MRLVMFSDTHGLHDRLTLPEGDVLIFTGDMCRHGTLQAVREFSDFLGRQPHPHKLVIAGNHDWPFQRQPQEARLAMESITYLEDAECVIDGIKFYGTPWQPRFYDWAFNLPRGAPLREVWSRVPDDTDVLLTHSPPLGVLDCTWDGRQVGCEELRSRTDELASLKVHVFGHIHEAYGSITLGGCRFFNASVCDRWNRRVVQEAWIAEL